MAHHKLTEIIRSPQMQNIASMLGAEAVSKLSRIITLLAMAAFLVPVEYGTAMLALACHDMIRLILRCGAGSQIVQCSEEELSGFARNGVLMQWLLCISLALVQFSAASVIANFYENPALANTLKQLSFVYFCYPLVSVRVFLIQRSNKLRYFGFCNGFCVSVENLSIAACLYLGAGIDAIVYGKFVYALLWVFLFSIVPIKNYGIEFHFPTIKRLFSNSVKLFQSELSRSLRMNADIFVAGKLLPAEIFGVYSFAKSASVAISQAVSNAVVCALYPQFCKMHRDGKIDGVSHSAQQTRLHVPMIWGVTAVMLMGYLCQAALAPVYIPLFFADIWTASVFPAVVLCFSAMPIFLLDMLCCLKRAAGEFSIESKIRLGHLLMLFCCLLLSGSENPMDIAMVVFCGASAWLGICVISMWLQTIKLQAGYTRYLQLRRDDKQQVQHPLSPSTSGEK